MKPAKTLLLTFEGDIALMSDVKSIVGQGEEFPVAEQLLPTAADSDYGPILSEVLVRFSPTVVVLAIPQAAHELAESVLRIIRSESRHVSVMVVLESNQLRRRGASAGGGGGGAGAVAGGRRLSAEHIARGSAGGGRGNSSCRQRGRTGRAIGRRIFSSLDQTKHGAAHATLLHRSFCRIQSNTKNNKGESYA